MKYEVRSYIKDNEKRKENNALALRVVRGEHNSFIPYSEVYNLFSGVGGLHDLDYSDYESYHDYSEDKKEIEQGQFFTPDTICKYIVDCLKITDEEKIADLTCGKGSFFNCIPNENRLYGCDIDSDAVSIANYLFPDAKIKNIDIADYYTHEEISLVIGNPPYNLNWIYEGKKISSQTAYLLYAAQILKKGGVIAAIVPNSFGSDTFSKSDMRKINAEFNFIAQINLNPLTFAHLGVKIFHTKIVFFQKKAKAIESERKYNYDDVLEFLEPAQIYETYMKEYRELTPHMKAKILLECNRDRTVKKAQSKYLIDRMLYQIKVSNNISETEKINATCSVDTLFTQVKPSDMSEIRWEKEKLTEEKLIDILRYILNQQHKKPKDIVRLIKTGTSIFYRGYSVESRKQAKHMNTKLVESNINSIVTGNFYLEQYAEYESLLSRKRKSYLCETIPFSKVHPSKDIFLWVKNFRLKGKDGVEIKLNEMQVYDTAQLLMKRYDAIQWEQGGGKTLAAIAVATYRLSHGLVKHAFVTSTALAILKTWKPMLDNFRIPYRIIRNKYDLRKILPGEFVLITLGRVLRHKKSIKHLIKLCKYRGQLIFDESQFMSSFSGSSTEGKIAKAMLHCFGRLSHKLLATGTSINNNVIESYSQLYLLYNGSVNMMCTNEMIYSYSEKDDNYSEKSNRYYNMPYPPYTDGLSLFRSSHLPVKLTVFGVVKTTPQIFNKSAFRKIIQQAFITKSFEEITGKDIKRPSEIRVSFNEDEKKLYNTAVERFKELEHRYYAAVKSKKMSARKKAQSDIIAQIIIMLRIASCASQFPEYKSNKIPSKILAVANHIKQHPNDYAVIGARMIGEVNQYARHFKELLPDRPIFKITGALTPEKRAQICLEDFKESGNGIIICTQQSLAESLSIDFVNYIYLVTLHWNNSKMSQFYHRFIRYTSNALKNIYYVNNPDTLETNLMFLLAAKEQMLRFVKGEDYTLSETFELMGFDLHAHQNVTMIDYDKDGKREMSWSKQLVA